jgi:hypothetical protein
MVSFQCVFQPTHTRPSDLTEFMPQVQRLVLVFRSRPPPCSIFPQVAGISLRNQNLINIGLCAAHRLTVSTAANASKPQRTIKSILHAFRRLRNTRGRRTTAEWVCMLFRTPQLTEPRHRTRGVPEGAVEKSDRGHRAEKSNGGVTDNDGNSGT